MMKGLSREGVGLYFDISEFDSRLHRPSPSAENPGCARAPLISGIFSELCDVFLRKKLQKESQLQTPKKRQENY
jgi:hypothetical protein